MPIIEKSGNGLLVPTSSYRRVKAFQGGAYYWEQQPQSIVRQYLGEFLPPVEASKEGGETYGWFRRFVGEKEVLWSSSIVGSRSIPAAQLELLERRLDELRRVGTAPETGPHNRQVIDNFRLPDPNVDPELYRLRGPPWSRRLEILWGCEKIEDTSVAPSVALQSLAKDRCYTLKRWLWFLLAALLLLVALLLLSKWGSAVGEKVAVLTNQPPRTVSTIDEHNEKTRYLSLNLAGEDPDGAIAEFNIDWGDGTKEILPGDSLKAERTFPKDGQYSVQVKAVDNLGKESLAQEIPVNFDHDAKEIAAAEARRIDEEKLVEEAAAKKAAEEQLAREEEDARLALLQLEEEQREEADRVEAERKAQEVAAENKKKTEEEFERWAEQERNSGKSEADKTPDLSSVSSDVPQEPSDFREIVTGRPVKPIEFEKPKYPRAALFAGREGTVTVQFTVGKDGRTKDLTIVAEKNGGDFRRAVLDSIRKARFQPAMIDGELIEQTIAYAITFQIQD